MQVSNRTPAVSTESGNVATRTAPVSGLVPKSPTKDADPNLSRPAADPQIPAVDNPPKETRERRSQAELERAVNAYQRNVFGFLRGRLTQDSDAEDLTQEVFLRYFVSSPVFDDPGMTLPWLLGISRNVLREFVRKGKNRRETVWTELCLEAEADSPEGTGAETPAFDVLPECIDALGSTAKNAIQLRYKGRLRMSEIGKKLKRTEGAVKVLVCRARQMLKNCIERKTRSATHD